MNTCRSAEASTYAQYLALDRVKRALENVGVTSLGNIRLNNPAPYGAGVFEGILDGTEEIDREETLQKYLYIYGKANVAITLNEHFGYTEGWYFLSEEEKQEIREALLFRLIDELPRARVLRLEGDAFLIGRVGPATYYIEIGQALCQKVVVGYEEVEEIADTSALEELEQLKRALPTRKVSKPIEKWVCNDAELTR